MTTPTIALVSSATDDPVDLRDISDDGRFVSYVTTSATGQALYVRDLIAGGTIPVVSYPDMVLSTGETLKSQIIGGDLSADGFTVVYGHSNGNLVNSPYPPEEVFVKNLLTNTASLIASGGAPQQGDKATISSDGRFVAYAFPTDPTGTDIRIFDRVSGSDKLAMHLADPNFGALQGVSTDGSLVLFETTDELLGETDLDADVFVKDLKTGALIKITDGGFTDDNGMTPDGRKVVYTDESAGQVYLHDFDNPFAKDRLISASMDGTPGNSFSRVMSISADGNFVAFTSFASNLVANDTNGDYDLFVKNLVTGEVTLVAAAPNNSITDAELSANGSRVVFESYSDLMPGDLDTDTLIDVYRAEIPTLEITAVAGDNIINAQEAASGAIITGTSNAGLGTVTVSIDGEIAGTARVKANGTWTLTTGPLDLSEGPHTVDASVTGDLGGKDTDSLAVIVDTIAPTLDITAISGDFVINGAESLAPVSVTGTSDAIGATVEVFADAKFAGTAVVQADGTWNAQISVAGLQGNEVFSARVADKAGNASIDVDVAYVDKSHAFASLSLAELNGANGFRVDGVEEFDWSGSSVSSAGDVNGDGFDDVIIGAPLAGPLGGVFDQPSGRSYVVFGAAGGFAPSLDLANLDGTNGFRIDGEVQSRLGESVSAGDINGDGFGDLVIGASQASPNGDQFAGETFVLFGHGGAFAPIVDATAVDGANGFRLAGIDKNDISGFSVASGGDVNGDGFDDVVVGAYGAKPGGAGLAGEAYVVFGKADGWAVSNDLSALNGTNGFRLQGNDGNVAGQGVAMAGDANGDGFDDVLVWSGTGTYLVFGKGDWSTVPTTNLAAIDGKNGVRLMWDEPGGNGNGSTFDPQAIASAGDINGDGFDDVIIGNRHAPGGGTAFAGESWVIFGKSDGWTAELKLSGADGVNGFRVAGARYNEAAGTAVGSAGDLNGDGFDDFIIGALDNGDEGYSLSQRGLTYVVYGKAGWGSNFDLGDINGGNGFRLDGIDHHDLSGFALAGAHDVNKDGFDDLIIGALNADAADNQKNDAGESYVVFGGDFLGLDKTVVLDPITGDDRLTAAELTKAVAVTGTSDAIGDTIELFIDGAPVGKATVAADGTWSTTIDASALAPGRYHVRATATEDGGFTASDGAILTVPGAVAGKVIDGYVSGATVFADANGNGVIDAGEFAAITDGGGAYALTGGEGATLVAIGGTDIATKLTFAGTLLAPAGSEVITPLTTLVQYMIENEGRSREESTGIINAKIEAGEKLDPLLADAWIDMALGIATGVPYVLGGARAAGAASLAGAALSALDGDGGVTMTAAYDAYMAALAHAFVVDPLATFADYDVRAVIHDAAESLGFSIQQNLSEANAAAAAEAMILALLGGRGGLGGGSGGGGGGGGAIESETEGLTGLEYLKMISAISLVAQGQATTDLFDAVGVAIIGPPPDFPFAARALAAAEPVDPYAALIAAYSGDALLDKIAAALHQLGDLDGPQFENAPVAVADSFSTDEDTALVVGAKDGVLANDSDADGDALSAILVSGPAHGALALNADGSFTYTPDADFHGSDSFTYKAGDGGLDSAVQTVTIAVDSANDAPVAKVDGYATDEDKALVVAVAGVLSNDTDADGDSLLALLVDGPDHGTLALSADGSFVYTPDANYNGADSFTYKVNDGAVDGNAATVNLTVNAINDGPSAPTTNNVTTDEDKASSPVAIGATDIDGDTLTYSVKAGSGPALGTVGFQAGGFVYTPNANANGVDSFVIVIEDGRGGKAEQTVAVTVNAVADAAVLGGVAAGKVTEDGALTANGKLSIVDPDAGEASFQAGSFKTAHGTLAIDAGGTWAYTLDNGDASVQALTAAQTLPDGVTVHAADGTAQQILITIQGADETTGAIVGNNKANNLNGTAGNDVIEGRGGSDTVHAGAGDDTIVATAGDGVDLYFGGSGNDTLDLSAITADATVNLIGVALGWQIGIDLLSSIENVIGGKGDDWLIGDDDANLLNGGAGNDSLVGDSGDDTLLGGTGKDSFSGGRGDDLIALGSTAFAGIDGGSGTDTIRLDRAGLGLDLTAIPQNAIRGIERIDLTGSGANVLTLGIQDVLDLSDSSNQLLVLGDAGDTVRRGAGWTTGAIVSIAGQDYQTYTAAKTTLLVDTDITIAAS